MLIWVGAAIATLGLLATLVAWIGALATTHRLGQERWFRGLLWSGIVGFVTVPLAGLGGILAGMAMLGYIVGGPDATSTPEIWSKPRIERWSRWALVPLLGGGLVALLIPNLTRQGGILQGQTFTTVALVDACFAVATIGVVVEAACWWAAVFNAHRLADQTWFKGIVWTGILAAATMPLLGLGAVIAAILGIAYQVEAPDGTEVRKATAPPTTPPSSLAALTR